MVLDGQANNQVPEKTQIKAQTMIMLVDGMILNILGGKIVNSNTTNTMDSSLAYGISCILAALKEQRPLEEKLIHKLLASHPVAPTLAVVIKLLCRLFQKYQPISANSRHFM